MSKTAILCVDDEVMVLSSLEIELRSAFGDAYLYEFAESGEEALELIEELRDEGVAIVAIVSDWLMPGMKGDEFLIEVHNKFPEITSIMLTGQADLLAIEKAKQEAALSHCLYKPWKSQELISAINSALHRECAIS
ncbi:MAG: response regulator [Oscillatoria princeps RMCB-10]|nr:response regulator [Oscillatoria princeps RMCB-10]